MSFYSNKLIKFYSSLKPPGNLPEGIQVLFPQQDARVIEIISVFYKKFFGDDHPRKLLLGINPGRYGAGITGVNFTAPKQLKENCGVEHPFPTSSELSAEFIYEMIGQYGGPKEFYANWFIGSVCPLGFIKNGKNLNYYDDRQLATAVTPFIVECIGKQIAMGFDTQQCICIGGEKNLKFLSSLNEKHKWFQKITPLPHPRFILQYHRKQKDKYIHQYLSALKLSD